MSRALACAVIESMDRTDPTRSHEARPSQRMRHRRTNWYAFAGWGLVAVAVFATLAGLAR